jgi:pyrroline-5-carboxylate reductase
MRTIGIIGCGNMGSAIKKALGNVITYDVDRKKRVSASSNLDLAGRSRVIILAVKPRDMEGVLEEIRSSLDSSKILISIAAGVTTKYIERKIGKKIAVIRVMPNMPALIGAGISAVCKGTFATGRDAAVARGLFSKLGSVVEVKETLMDAVTAVSGSGPAYFFYLAEVLATAGMGLGLDKKTAHKLAVETAFGSARLLREGGENAAALRARVASKGGTTEAAFEKFFEHNLGGILAKGIYAAHNRSKKLGVG